MNILRPCNHPGCRKYACERGYCAEHAELLRKRKRENRNIHDGYSFYSAQRWRRTRRIFLAENPLCVICRAPATEVDHIIPHRGDSTLFWDMANWQPLCHACHSRKTCAEDGGFGHSVKQRGRGDEK